MTYKLVFKQDAKKEWDKLDPTIREQFKKKLIERLDDPRVDASRLSGMKNCYKIKLRSAGFRLVYQVRDSEILISVVAVGKRDRNQVYKIAIKRI
jgi:mRNA interferase RelE/StbE